MKKSVNGREQNKIIILHVEMRWWKWQKASASIARSQIGFSFLIFFLAMFPLIVFGFSGERNVFPRRLHSCLMHQKSGECRCNYRNAVDSNLIALLILWKFGAIKKKRFWGNRSKQKFLAPLASDCVIMLPEFNDALCLWCNDTIVCFTCWET